MEVRAVEAVHSDHAGLGVEVAFVRVRGIQVILKNSEPIQVLNLKHNETMKQQNFTRLEFAFESADILSKKQLMVRD